METVFLIDVDNTLLDNDAVVSDLGEHLDRVVGSNAAKNYWSIFEQLRSEVGYADYLGALQRFRGEYPHELAILAVSRFLIDYPFARRLYPEALKVISHLSQWGNTVVLSDGDVVFQPHKVHSSGIGQAVENRVLIYVHKQDELADVESRFPADHYVLVDDKLRILSAVKKIWNARVTTVFVAQGHYAREPHLLETYGKPDVSVSCIGELLACRLTFERDGRPALG